MALKKLLKTINLNTVYYQSNNDIKVAKIDQNLQSYSSNAMVDEVSKTLSEL